MGRLLLMLIMTTSLFAQARIECYSEENRRVAKLHITPMAKERTVRFIWKTEGDRNDTRERAIKLPSWHTSIYDYRLGPRDGVIALEAVIIEGKVHPLKCRFKE